MKIRSKFQILSIKDSAALIVDLNGQKSVTNDAENVIKYIVEQHPHVSRFFYKDSDGHWDEMFLDDADMANFAPISDEEMEFYNLIND